MRKLIGYKNRYHNSNLVKSINPTVEIRKASCLKFLNISDDKRFKFGFLQQAVVCSTFLPNENQHYFGLCDGWFQKQRNRDAPLKNRPNSTSDCAGNQSCAPGDTAQLQHPRPPGSQTAKSQSLRCFCGNPATILCLQRPLHLLPAPLPGLPGSLSRPVSLETRWYCSRRATCCMEAGELLFCFKV